MQMTIIEPTAAPEMKRRIRVGAYCRVSTDASDQKHSFNVQKMHFSMLYANSANYELVDIYADMGISGTKAAFRPEFQRMLDDARCGKIDRVVCKSISRFARNTKDCLTALRELKQLGVSVLPNTAGCTSAREAVQLAHMARELYGTPWVKLEVVGDDYTLQPDMQQLLQAAQALVREGFVVFPYCTDDLVGCRRLSCRFSGRFRRERGNDALVGRGGNDCAARRAEHRATRHDSHSRNHPRHGLSDARRRARNSVEKRGGTGFANDIDCDGRVA